VKVASWDGQNALEPLSVWVFDLGLIDFVDPAPQWFAHAACRGRTEMFFLDKGPSATEVKAL